METRPTNRHWMMLVVATITAFIVAPAAVWASHQFNDVPDSHTFHDSISWMADNDITVGCNPPDSDEFCPDEAVTRGQMSAFMKRLAQFQVVDAGTVQGLGIYADIVSVDVNNAENNEEECEPTESLLGPDHDFGTFFTTYQLLSVPEATDFFTFDVNVAASDRDPNNDLPESGFLICFATIDGGELPDGTYTLFRIESHETPAS